MNGKRSKKGWSGMGEEGKKGKRTEGTANDWEAKLRNICSYLRRYGRRKAKALKRCAFERKRRYRHWRNPTATTAERKKAK